MSTQAYGSITIVDIGDLGELTVTPESNQPTLVIYNPDNQSYTPNWGGTPNLYLTPVVYYGGQKLLDANSTSLPSGLTVTWKRQYGNGTITTISTGSPANHTITSAGRLQVSATQLSTSNTLLTYIVEVAYTEPNLGTTTLNASGQITFGLIQNAATLKMITVSGAGAFLYNALNQCQNSPIVLTASHTGVNISKWQYKSGSSWVDISGATSDTLSVAENASYFSSETLLLRALGSDGITYDEHSIVKLRDGAPGDQVVSAVLTNEDQMVPCDSGGVPIGSVNYPTSLTIYEGNTAVTSAWTITTSTTNVSGNGAWASNSAYYTYTVTSVDSTATVGAVNFTCSRSSYNSISKSFQLVKVKAGADGEPGTSPTVYDLQCDTLVVNRAEDGSVSPTSINLNAYYQTGNATRSAYNGQFKVYLDDNTSVDAQTANATSNFTYTVPQPQSSPPSSADLFSKIRVELYNTDKSVKYDQQTIVCVSDGATGSQGPGGLNFVLGNYGDQIPCGIDGNVGSSSIIKDIPFQAFQGTTQVYCEATVSSGTISSKITSSVTQNSKVTLTFHKNTDLGGTDQGSVVIVLTAKTSASGTTLGSQTFTYTWVKNKQGANAVAFQLYTPNGNVVSNNDNNITVSPLLLEGSTDKTSGSGATYAWYRYSSGSYVLIESHQSTDSIYIDTSNNLIVKPTAVDSYLSIKCVVTYTPTGASSSSTFTAYQSIYDKTDIFQISVISTLGDKLINSVGVGILYTRVMRNGEIYDEIVSTAVATANSATALNSAVGKSGITGSAPSSYCWYATSSNLTLYKKSGSTWSAVSSANDPHVATYNWSGVHISDNSNATIYGWSGSKNKAILLNGSIVNKKTMFNVTMTTPST